MMNNTHDWGLGWGLPFFGIFFWILIIVGIVFFIRWIAKKKPQDKQESPLTTLKRRYASGEIDHNTYERIKKSLNE